MAREGPALAIEVLVFAVFAIHCQCLPFQCQRMGFLCHGEHSIWPRNSFHWQTDCQWKSRRSFSGNKNLFLGKEADSLAMKVCSTMGSIEKKFFLLPNLYLSFPARKANSLAMIAMDVRSLTFTITPLSLAKKKMVKFVKFYWQRCYTFIVMNCL